MDEAQGIA